MSADYHSFLRRCRDQGAGLDPGFLDETRRMSLEGIKYSCWPDALHKTIVVAGNILRLESDTRLARKPIKDDGSDQFRDPAGKMLMDIINASIDPVVDPGIPTFNGPEARGVSSISACDSSEAYFANTFLSLKRKEPRRGFGAQLFVDHAERPVMLRKYDHVQSTLTLENIIINGVPYARGSVMRVETATDTVRGSKIEGTPHTGLLVGSTDDIVRIAFARRSAYAAPSWQRADWNLDDSEGRQATEFVNIASMDTLVDIAAAVAQNLSQLKVLTPGAN